MSLQYDYKYGRRNYLKNLLEQNRGISEIVLFVVRQPIWKITWNLRNYVRESIEQNQLSDNELTQLVKELLTVVVRKL